MSDSPLTPSAQTNQQEVFTNRSDDSNAANVEQRSDEAYVHLVS